MLVDETSWTRLNKSPPPALTPKTPPILPASTAMSTAVPLELFGAVGGCHHAATGA